MTNKRLRVRKGSIAYYTIRGAKVVIKIIGVLLLLAGVMYVSYLDTVVRRLGN